MQKDRGWMAVPIFKKVRGLNVKNRTVLQLFLNCSGPRVESRKDQGFFSKTTTTDRYPAWSNGSGPLDRDRAIQCEAVRGI